ncbi:MAG: hypothetical protein M1816_006255 [Peltula sp. TS41687]|nr:MAG: hypothetical protein M1816_006255 [Peltula sp. TS41687]
MDYHLADEDEDAEHEDDPMMDVKMFPAGASVPNLDGQLSSTPAAGPDVESEDAEGDLQEEDNDDDDDDEAVGPVKVPEDEADSGSEVQGEKNAASDEDVSNGNSSDEEMSEKGSSDGESDGGAEWDEESNDAEDDDGAVVNTNHCIFCGEDEEHDPSEEYEEYLTCDVCGDNSHRQCARNENSHVPDNEGEKWRCPTCIENALEPDQANKRTSTRRRSSAHQLTRDLLPAQRGASRPGSHSVFNQLIVNDDPLDGSRLLRKRKASSDGVEEGRSSSSRRRKKSKLDSDSETESSVNPPTRPDKGGKRVRGSVEAVRKDLESKLGSLSPRPRPSRNSRQRSLKKTTEGSSVKVIKTGVKTLIVSFRVDAAALSKILSSEPKRKNRRPPKPPEPQPQTAYPYPITPFSSTYATPFYSFHERENDELKSKPYGGILSEADADTSKTLPQAADRERFNEAKRKAEEAWSKRATDPNATGGGGGGGGGSSGGAFSQKIAGPASKIQCINFGGFEIDTWYAAPYPEEYSRNRVLYICEFCLKYMSSEYVAWRHKLKCPAKHPPGDEIYREGSISIFEVDGRKNPVYCQNLCLLAKLFLGSKTLYYDVEPFLFYVMTEYDELGCRFVGYFSKEKRPSSSNNVSCILTLPIHQRKGYGNLLIDFSYLLTRVERKTGSPEKPLSDMGLVSYRNYWRLILCYELLNQKGPISIMDISNHTGMTPDDIVSGLEGLRALVRDPVTGTYALRLDHTYYREYIDKWEAKKYVRLNPEALTWTPFIMGRSNLAHLEHAPPLATLAPRDDDEEREADMERNQPEEGVQMETMAGLGGDRSNHAPINGIDDHDRMEIDPPTITQPVLTPAIDTTDQPIPTASHSGLTVNPRLPGPAPPKTPVSKPSGRTAQGPSHVPSSLTPSSAAAAALPAHPIPPTRFEIFPPLPGTVTKRKPGRPFGTFRKRGGGTPASAAARRNNPPPPPPPPPKSGSGGYDGAEDTADGTRRIQCH